MSQSTVGIVAWSLFAAVPLLLTAAEKNSQPAASAAKGKKEVLAALEAEAAGDNARRADLLDQAASLAPELAEANWHLARVQADGKWLDLAAAEARAAADGQLAEYQSLRDEAEGNARLLKGLARWCTKAGWEDTARLHYAQLLARNDLDETTTKEAIQRLDLHFVGGSWVTGEDWKAQQERVKASGESVRKYRPQLARFAEAIDGTDYLKRERAVNELGQLDDPLAIFALETFLLDGGEEFQLRVVEKLAEFPEYAASEALVRFAVLPKSINVRDKAADALSKRPLHEYVPLLLSGLTTPIRSQFQVTALPNGVITYTHVLSRETPQQKVVHVATQVTRPRLMSGTLRFPQRPRGQVLAVIFDDTMWVMERQLANETQIRAQNNQLAAQVAAQAQDSSNRYILRALAAATGQQLPDDANAWRGWWLDYNQYHWPQQTQVSYLNSTVRYEAPPLVRIITVGGGGHSCFLAGTLVRSQTGLTPIETLKAGDRVLSQDQDTGELAYKVVLRTTLRPPAKMVKITAAGEEIVTTLGHPFWVAGHGWKMAKELAAGDLLHSAFGAAPIESIEPAGEAEAHNLVVDDFNTYFVGRTGVLVHDNEFRRPTRSLVPGLVRNGE